jgi:Family of unknown function (DUF5681)
MSGDSENDKSDNVNPNANGANPKVGYKSAPIHTRFQKGKSGNPRGRQKGVRNFTADAKRTLELPVTVAENGKTRNASTQEAIFRRLRDKALKGDSRSIEILIGIASKVNNDGPGQSPDAQGLSADDQAIFEAFVTDVRTRSDPGDPANLAPAKEDSDGDR